MGSTSTAAGAEIDPDSVDWGSADMRAYSFVQPPRRQESARRRGSSVSRTSMTSCMHDTVERELFAQSARALSHGCIRVQNPRRFAEILLSEGNSYSEDKVANEIAGGGEITMHHQVPVHMTYFTAMVGRHGPDIHLQRHLRPRQPAVVGADGPGAQI